MICFAMDVYSSVFKFRFELAGLRHFGGRIQNAEDFVLTHDDELFAIQLDFAARVLSEENAISDLHIARNQRSVFQTLAVPDSHHLALLGLLFRRVGDDDSALHRFLLLDPFDNKAIVEWS